MNKIKKEMELNYGVEIGYKNFEQPQNILTTVRTLARKAKNKDLFKHNSLSMNKENTLSGKSKFQKAFENSFLNLLYQPIISLEKQRSQKSKYFYLIQDLTVHI